MPDADRTALRRMAWAFAILAIGLVVWSAATGAVTGRWDACEHLRLLITSLLGVPPTYMLARRLNRAATARQRK